MGKKYIPCGGCGATDPIQRCIGCFHPFEELQGSLKEPTDEEQRVMNKTTDKLFVLNKAKGAVWVKASERLPAIEDAYDYPPKYILKCKYDGSRGQVHIFHVTAEEMREIIRNWDYCEWLDESGTPAAERKESDAVEFLEWAYQNRWFNKEGDLWCHTFEQGTRVSDATYKKNYMKTTAQLYQLFKQRLAGSGGKEGKS